MCDPVTITALVVMAGSQIYAGSAAAKQASYQAKVAEINRGEANKAAADALDRGRIAERREYRQQSQLQGAQIAAQAANGLEIDFGSPSQVLGDTAMIGAEDAFTIRENAIRESRGFSINAMNYDAEAKAKRAESSSIQVATAFKVANTVLGSATQSGFSGFGGGAGGDFDMGVPGIGGGGLMRTQNGGYIPRTLR